MKTYSDLAKIARKIDSVYVKDGIHTTEAGGLIDQFHDAMMYINDSSFTIMGAFDYDQTTIEGASDMLEKNLKAIRHYAKIHKLIGTIPNTF
tara:strand:+ start:73 stop:348 length:276 start_codon:yes stop_codon:yes gene_type:complete